MVICFECKRETKEQLDALMQSGSFIDLSEVIAVAIANQALLHRSGDNSPVVLAAQRQENVPTATAAVPKAPPPFKPPTIFALRSDTAREPIAPAPQMKGTRADDDFSQADWIFGQHNKLLPVKASCRALANLLSQSPNGLNAVEAARMVANHAADLGVCLHALDEKHNRIRDDMLSVAFPGRSDPDKGRIRYANQFVVGVTKAGEITGLLVDLGLLNKIEPSKLQVSLTDAGWTFAQLRNPVLDLESGNPDSKFSSEERAFLADHIARNIAAERSAFRQVLTAIHSGHDNPDKLRAAFDGLEKEDAKNKLYFATQRSGVLSRMADLGLLRRHREGTRARYAITDDGAAFLNLQ